MIISKKNLESIIRRLNSHNMFSKTKNIGTFRVQMNTMDMGDTYRYMCKITWHHPALSISSHVVSAKWRDIFKKDLKKKEEETINELWEHMLLEFYMLSTFGKGGVFHAPHMKRPIIMIPIQKLVLEEEEAVRFINENI